MDFLTSLAQMIAQFFTGAIGGVVRAVFGSAAAMKKGDSFDAGKVLTTIVVSGVGGGFASASGMDVISSAGIGYASSEMFDKSRTMFVPKQTVTDLDVYADGQVTNVVNGVTVVWDNFWNIQVLESEYKANNDYRLKTGSVSGYKDGQATGSIADLGELVYSVAHGRSVLKTYYDKYRTLSPKFN